MSRALFAFAIEQHDFRVASHDDADARRVLDHVLVAHFHFTVERRFRGKKLSIEIKNPNGVCKGIKEVTLNGVKLDGIELKATYESGRTETVSDTSLMTVSGFNSTKRGAQTLSLEYGGQSTTFDVTVNMLWWQCFIKIVLFGWIWYR